MIKVGSVIQVKEHVPAWAGCVMIVDEVNKWGVRACMRLPGREGNITFLRLDYGEYYYVGEAEFIWPGDDGE